ncbi:unnamed protein product [Symbiodinium sp. CCMP2592]|nr:unnamed protein product [Symbiodinium sp. CCMP2592]
MDTSTDVYHLLNNSLGGFGSVLASALLSIILQDEDGHPVEGALATPLTFNLTTVGNASSEPGVTCKFWDEEMEVWSTDGVTMLSAADGVVTCSTTHLSIFAIIVDTIISTLACSNAAAIFSLEGLQFLQRVAWALRPPSVLNWVILLMGAFLLCLAACADRRTRHRLKVLKATLDFCDKFEKAKASQEQHEMFDIYGFRSLCSCDVARSVCSAVVRRRTGVSLDVLNRMYADTGTTASHDLAKSALDKFWQINCCSKLVVLFRMNCAYINVLEPRTTSTCLQRTAVLIARLYSGWAVSAVFYSSSSIAAGQPDCEPKVALLETVVRSVVIAFITAAVGALPLALVMALVTKVVLIPMQIRLMLFWTLLTAYFLLCLMVVCIFIASVSLSDSEKWFVSALTNVLTGAIFSPLLISSVMSCWLRKLEQLITKVASQWQSQKLQELVHMESIWLSEVALKTVLKSDPVEMTITCQVAGHDEVTELQEDEGSFRSPIPYKLEAHQLFVLSVYRGARDTTQRNLIACAFFHVDQLQDGYFQGSLPLFLDDNNLHVALNATVTVVSETKPKRDVARVSESPESYEAPTVIPVAPEPGEFMEIAQVEEKEDAETNVPEELAEPVAMPSLVPWQPEEPSEANVPRELPEPSVVSIPPEKPAETSVSRELSGPMTLPARQEDLSKKEPTQASGVKEPELQMASEAPEMQVPPPMQEPPVTGSVLFLYTISLTFGRNTFRRLKLKQG